MQHQVVDIFCTPTGNVVNVLKINVHHFFVDYDNISFKVKYSMIQYEKRK
jgi:hypothetical protein